MSIIREIFRGDDDTPTRVEFEADLRAWEITFTTVPLTETEVDELLLHAYEPEGYPGREYEPDW